MTLKSFLKNLKGKKEEPVVAKTWKEKRRSNRIYIEEDLPVAVHLLKPTDGESTTTVVGQVRTVSLRGCSVRFASAEQAGKFQPGQICMASLTIEGFSVPLSVEVVRAITEDEVGLQFKPPYPRELERLEKFLGPRFLGASLREIDGTLLQQSGDKVLRWFQGANDTSLFSWSDKGSGTISQQQLVFLSHVVEWSGDGDLKTGRVRQDAPTERSQGWVRADVLDFDQSANTEILQEARVLMALAQIDSRVKKTFLSRIR